MTDLRQAAQQALEPSDFQKWSVLAFRALDDAGRVLMTIEPESTSEGELLDRLKETIRELLVQALVLNGVTTRRQMDKQFQFGKLDTDALLIEQSKKQQAEPVAREGFNDWWDGDYDDSANRFEKDSAAYWAWAGWQAAQRQWVGLTDEDFLEACQLAERGNYLVAFQRIQTKLKERNT